jgi:hypothetical protein
MERRELNKCSPGNRGCSQKWQALGRGRDANRQVGRLHVRVRGTEAEERGGRGGGGGARLKRGGGDAAHIAALHSWLHRAIARILSIVSAL